MAAGYRSPAAFWLGGAAAPPRAPGYRSLLAFWMGGACGWSYIPVPIPPIPPLPILVPEEGGLAFAGRRRIDDEEVEEFLQIWTVWNDNE